MCRDLLRVTKRLAIQSGAAQLSLHCNQRHRADSNVIRITQHQRGFAESFNVFLRAGSCSPIGGGREIIQAWSVDHNTKRAGHFQGPGNRINSPYERGKGSGSWSIDPTTIRPIFAVIRAPPQVGG